MKFDFIIQRKENIEDRFEIDGPHFPEAFIRFAAETILSGHKVKVVPDGEHLSDFIEISTMAQVESFAKSQGIDFNRG